MNSDTLYCEMTKLTFRKSELTVPYLFFKDKYGEEYTTTQIDTLNLILIQNAYREKNSIPFADEIKDLRKRYGLTAKKMSKLLGFGENQYRLYEDGEMPSLSNAKMISGTEDTGFVERLIAEAPGLFTEREHEKLRKRISEIKSSLKDHKANALYSKFARPRNRYNGYASLCSEKLEQLMIFFTHHLSGVFETKLNKLLFYTDFYHYKFHARGISGLQYRAITYGPVPLNYGTLYESFDSLRKDIVERAGYTGSIIYAEKDFDPSLFTDDELATMQKILRHFKSTSSKSISLKSHEEAAWLKNEASRSIIDYSDAFTLKLEF